MDTPSEHTILDSIFLSEDPDAKIQEILETPNVSWFLRYHLSEQRQNILSWYPTASSDSILEIGAEYGAVTPALLKNDASVTSLETNSDVTAVLQQRFKKEERWTLQTALPENSEQAAKYSLITCIGQLHRWSEFSQGTEISSAADFLKYLRSLLAPGGSIFLSVDNVYGLKYWSGASNDSTGDFFDSIEDPDTMSESMLSKTKLKQLLDESGFSNIRFYYPVPDYKVPTEIYSDQYLPSKNHPIRPSAFPSEDYNHAREIIFNEAKVMQKLTEVDMFPFFSNSYLVQAILDTSSL